MPPKSGKTNKNSPWDEMPRERFLFREEQDEERKPRRFSPIAFVILFAAVAAILYYVFFGSASPNVGVEFSKPDNVLLGAPFTVNVTFSNYSDNILKNARLSVALPEGVTFVGQSDEERIREQALGDLGPGSVNQQSFTLIATEGAETLKHLQATLSYSTGGDSKAEFEADGEIDIPIGEPAVALEFETPENIVSGESFKVVVKYRNNTDSDMKNLTLRLDYPPTFRFERSDVDPTSGNATWDLGSLTKGSDEKITITGNVVGPDQTLVNIVGRITAGLMGEKYTVAEQAASFSISTAPLSVKATANDSADYLSRIGDTIRYSLVYKNNTDKSFQDVTISAKLAGELFDFSTIQSSGLFDSASKKITWTSATVPELSNVPPGAEGSVQAIIKLVGAFPIKRLSDKNYTLKLQGEISSPTISGSGSGRTISVANLETKVVGAVVLDARAYFRDALSGILNSGPYPPKIGVPTQYTIHWVIKNFATDIGNVKVSAPLGPGVRFTSTTKSTADTGPTYNSGNGMVTWEIPGVPAGKGVVGEPHEAIFQVELTPQAGQVGQDAILIGNSLMEAQDGFTGSALSASEGPQTTAVPDDTTVQGDRHIQQ